MAARKRSAASMPRAKCMTWARAQRAETVRGFVRDVLPAMADGRIKPLIYKVFSFDDLPAAKARIESNTQVGKIVVRVA